MFLSSHNWFGGKCESCIRSRGSPNSHWWEAWAAGCEVALWSSTYGEVLDGVGLRSGKSTGSVLLISLDFLNVHCCTVGCLLWPKQKEIWSVKPSTWVALSMGLLLQCSVQVVRLVQGYWCGLFSISEFAWCPNTHANHFANVLLLLLGVLLLDFFLRLHKQTNQQTSRQTNRQKSQQSMNQ